MGVANVHSTPVDLTPMPGAKLQACPRCEGTNNIVSRHRRRGATVVRERFCRECRQRFYTESSDDVTESHCGNPFVARNVPSLWKRQTHDRFE